MLKGSWQVLILQQIAPFASFISFALCCCGQPTPAPGMLPLSTSSGMHKFSLPLNVEVADIGTDPTNTSYHLLKPSPPST